MTKKVTHTVMALLLPVLGTGAVETALAEDVDARREKTRAAISNAMQVEAGEEQAVRSFKPVSVADIDAFVGKRVRLETYYGSPVEGTLVKVQGKRLYVRRHVQNGSAIYPIDKTKVSDLEVYY